VKRQHGTDKCRVGSPGSRLDMGRGPSWVLNGSCHLAFAAPVGCFLGPCSGSILWQACTLCLLIQLPCMQLSHSFPQVHHFRWFSVFSRFSLAVEVVASWL
jgi:hypothetical protein